MVEFPTSLSCMLFYSQMMWPFLGKARALARVCRSHKMCDTRLIFTAIISACMCAALAEITQWDKACGNGAASPAAYDETEIADPIRTVFECRRTWLSYNAAVRVTAGGEMRRVCCCPLSTLYFICRLTQRDMYLFFFYHQTKRLIQLLCACKHCVIRQRSWTSSLIIPITFDYKLCYKQLEPSWQSVTFNGDD